MNIKKLCSVLLATALLLCALISCEKIPDPNQKPNYNPTTPEEYLAVMNEVMKTQKYKATEVDTRTKIISDYSDTQTETSVAIFDGLNMLTNDEESGVQVQILLYDNVCYVDLNGKKVKFATSAQELFASITGEQVVDYSKLVYESFTLSTNEDGNTVVSGKGLKEESQAAINGLFNALGANMTTDFKAFEFSAVLDSEYRTISTHVTVLGTGSIGGTPIKMQLNEVTTYEYGEQYTLNPPADSDSYTTVDSFDDLFE